TEQLIVIQRKRFPQIFMALHTIANTRHFSQTPFAWLAIHLRCFAPKFQLTVEWTVEICPVDEREDHAAFSVSFAFLAGRTLQPIESRRRGLFRCFIAEILTVTLSFF